MGSQAGVVVQGDGELEQAGNTDVSWQAEMESGHGILPVNFMALLESYYAGPPGELIDARHYDWRWDSPAVDSGRWKQARTIGSAAARGTTDSPTIWMLIPDSLPQMEMTRIPAGRVVSSSGTTSENAAYTVAPNTKASVLLDAGALTTAYPEVTVGGGSGARVRVTYAEALVDDQK